MKNFTYYILLLILFSTLSTSCGSGHSKALDFYNKGKAHYEKKELDRARVFFTQALESDGSLHNARLMLAKIAYYEKKYETALKELDEILDDAADHTGGLYWKARTLIVMPGKDGSTDREKEAVMCLQKILELDSHHLPARSMLALIYEKQKKYKEAIYQYNMLLKDQEIIVTARANLGVLYQRMGLSDKSKEELNAAREMARIADLPDDTIKLILQEIEE